MSAILPLLLLAPLAQDTARYPEMPEGWPAPVPVADADADTPAAMKPYTEVIPGTQVTFDLVPIPGGSFLRGSPEEEPERRPDEGPQHEVRVSPFWMGKCEVTWDEYQLFMLQLDRSLRERGASAPVEQDRWADAVSRPTPPYVPMDFDMGVQGFPAISMTQFAARHYTKWLSLKTGRVYRLPTEAEWEYACRAGSTGAYSFGDDPRQLDEYAWYFDNSDDAYHPVGRKKPNAWGLHDMHGNVAEWVLDAHEDDAYRLLVDAGLPARDPVSWPQQPYPRVVRGGSWDDDADELRSAARRGSHKGWMIQDPQVPKSIWYHTDARFVGLRVVRPFRGLDPEERTRAWEPDLDSVREILEKQRHGGR